MIRSVVDYQNQTMYLRDQMTGGELDWSNKPNPYKNYLEAKAVPLSRELDLPRVSAALGLAGEIRGRKRNLTCGELARLLFLSYGFTAQVDYGSELFLYRSAPSAGALYPVEVYFVAAGVPDLEDGLYHYSLIDFALTRLRTGTPWPGVPAPALILTGLFFRSAWKYRDRALRYCLLDAGHVGENIMRCGTVLGLEPVFSGEFDDALVNEYLGLDTGSEAALAVVHLGPQFAGTGDGTASKDNNIPQAEPVSSQEKRFDAIRQGAELTAVPLLHPDTAPSGPGVFSRQLRRPDWSDGQEPTLVQVIQQRRSRRNFRPRTFTKDELARLLTLVVGPGEERLADCGVVLNEIQDLADGFYRVGNQGLGLELVKGGFLGPSLAWASLGQEWMGRANTVLVLSAPLGQLENRLGPRSFRLAYLEAGRMGQRAYLAAETMGWGCCGIGAFYDEDVRRVLNMSDEEYPLYILPAGPIKKRTHGGRTAPA